MIRIDDTLIVNPALVTNAEAGKAGGTIIWFANGSSARTHTSLGGVLHAFERAAVKARKRAASNP